MKLATIFTVIALIVLRYSRGVLDDDTGTMIMTLIYTRDFND